MDPNVGSEQPNSKTWLRSDSLSSASKPYQTAGDVFSIENREGNAVGAEIPQFRTQFGIRKKDKRRDIFGTFKGPHRSIPWISSGYYVILANYK